MRRTISPRGRQSSQVTISIEAYQGKVWMVSVDQPFICETIMESAQVDSLINLLSQAAKEVSGGADTT